jgi:DNA-directed RNA polymerase specialized sigma24 family protein
MGAVRNPDTAGDLAQEFALRFLRGAFRHADPGRGRFRDYMKTALIHLVNDYRSARSASSRPLPPDTADPVSLNLAIDARTAQHGVRCGVAREYYARPEENENSHANLGCG